MPRKFIPMSVIPKASSHFVFDNTNSLHAQESSVSIFNYLSRREHANKPLLLITSQTFEWEAENVETLEVKALTRDKSVQHLIARFQLSQADMDKERALNFLIQKLYECVQGYPLAQQLAAANVGYMNKPEPINLLRSRLEAFIGRATELDEKCVML